MRSVIPPPWQALNNNNNSMNKPDFNNNFNQKEYDGANWCIMYDNTYDHDSRIKELAFGISNYFNQLMAKREFNPKPLKNPVLHGCNMSKLSEIRDFLRNGNFNVALFIIPNDTLGSKMKIDISRYINFEKSPKNRLTSYRIREL